jgi:hypothetical protein
MKIAENLEQFVSHIREYIDTRKDLLVLNVSEKVSTAAAGIVSSVILGIAGIFILFFASVGIALWLGNAIGNTWSGFFYVGLFYALLALIIYSIRNSVIKMQIMNNLLKKFHSHESN